MAVVDFPMEMALVVECYMGYIVAVVVVESFLLSFLLQSQKLLIQW